MQREVHVCSRVGIRARAWVHEATGYHDIVCMHNSSTSIIMYETLLNQNSGLTS